MPIDTANERRSVSGYTNLPVYPVADAVIDASDREHSSWLYAGIPAGTPPPTLFGNICGTTVLLASPSGVISINPIVGSVISPIIVGSLVEVVGPGGQISVIRVVGVVQECED